MSTHKKVQARVRNASRRDQEKLTQDMHRACRELELDENLTIWTESFPPSPAALTEIEDWCGYSGKNFLDIVANESEQRRWYEREYQHQTNIVHHEQSSCVVWSIAGVLVFVNLVTFIIFLFKIL